MEIGKLFFSDLYQLVSVGGRKWNQKSRAGEKRPMKVATGGEQIDPF